MALAAAPFRLLAWEPPYAEGTALKRQKTTTTTTKRQKGCVTFVFVVE